MLKLTKYYNFYQSLIKSKVEKNDLSRLIFLSIA